MSEYHQIYATLQYLWSSFTETHVDTVVRWRSNRHWCPSGSQTCQQGALLQSVVMIHTMNHIQSLLFSTMYFATILYVIEIPFQRFAWVSLAFGLFYYVTFSWVFGFPVYSTVWCKHTFIIVRSRFLQQLHLQETREETFNIAITEDHMFKTL